ncbi:MAG: universal stress protein [Acidimicrobiales bacterium]|nr:universal stress protein [Acidimicrobiales bacterium]
MTAVVVVGVDGSEQARRALTWAAEEAKLRGARLRVVHVWSYLAQTGEAFDPTYGDDDARRLLQEAVAGLDDGVDIELTAVCDLPARGLLDSSRDADLLVVGARGMGGFGGLLLGSVSQQVAQHAPCPVVIVPQPKDPAPA